MCSSDMIWLTNVFKKCLNVPPFVIPQVASYKLKVIAYDAGDEFVGIPSKTGSLNLDVQIADTNDNFPLFQTNSSQVTNDEFQ